MRHRHKADVQMEAQQKAKGPFLHFIVDGYHTIRRHFHPEEYPLDKKEEKKEAPPPPPPKQESKAEV